MNQPADTFYVLKEGGNYYPKTFITPADGVGEERKVTYEIKNKLIAGGGEIVKVRLVEID